MERQQSSGRERPLSGSKCVNIREWLDIFGGELLLVLELSSG